MWVTSRTDSCLSKGSITSLMKEVKKLNASYLWITNSGRHTISSSHMGQLILNNSQIANRLCYPSHLKVIYLHV